MKKIIISDCDGILTDGTAIYTSDGKIGKVYGSFDSEAIQYAHDNDWEILFVSADEQGWPITYKRLSQYLNKGLCKCQNANANDRLELVNKYKKMGYLVVFVGDSISDIPAGKASSLFCTTHNGFDEVKYWCKYISPRNGGDGGFAQIVYYVDDYVKGNY